MINVLHFPNWKHQKRLTLGHKNKKGRITFSQKPIPPPLSHSTRRLAKQSVFVTTCQWAQSASNSNDLYAWLPMNARQLTNFQKSHQANDSGEMNGFQDHHHCRYYYLHESGELDLPVGRVIESVDQEWGT